MPKFAMLVRSNPEAEGNGTPSTSLLTDMMAYNTSMVDAGVMLSGDGFLPSEKGARVTYGSDKTVTPGPFAPETLVAGFWVIQAKDLDEAVEWAKKAPFKGEDAVVEVRTIATGEDFGQEMTPELKDKEAELKKKLEGQ